MLGAIGADEGGRAYRQRLATLAIGSQESLSTRKAVAEWCVQSDALARPRP